MKVIENVRKGHLWAFISLHALSQLPVLDIDNKEQTKQSLVVCAMIFIMRFYAGIFLLTAFPSNLLSMCAHIHTRIYAVTLKHIRKDTIHTHICILKTYTHI